MDTHSSVHHQDLEKTWNNQVEAANERLETSWLEAENSQQRVGDLRQYNTSSVDEGLRHYITSIV